MGLFSSEQKSESKSRATPYNPLHFQEWTNQMFDLSRTPRELYPGQMYADLTPEQEAALQSRMGFVEGFGGGIMDPTRAAWESTLTAPDVAANPYVNAMLDRQRAGAVETLQQDILPSLRLGAIGATGGLGGSRQGLAEGRAAGETMEALLDAQAQTQLGAYRQGLQQQQYGIGAAPGVASMELMPSDVMMGVGDIRRAEEQRGIDEARMRHEFGQEEPWQRAERFAGTYMPYTLPYATRESESTTETTPSGLQIAGQLAGTALTGAMGLGAMGFGPAAGIFSGAGGAAAGGAAAPASMMSAGGNPWGQALATNMAANMAAPPGWGYPSSNFGMPRRY